MKKEGEIEPEFLSSALLPESFLFLFGKTDSLTLFLELHALLTSYRRFLITFKEEFFIFLVKITKNTKIKDLLYTKKNL